MTNEPRWLLRIGTKLDDADAFVTQFARLVDGRRMMLATRERHADGSVLDFQIRLRDRSVVFAGTARVVGTSPARAGRPFDGLLVELGALDEASQEMLARLQVARLPVEPNVSHDTVPVSAELLAGIPELAPRRSTRPLSAGDLGARRAEPSATRPPQLGRRPARPADGARVTASLPEPLVRPAAQVTARVRALEERTLMLATTAGFLVLGLVVVMRLLTS